MGKEGDLWDDSALIDAFDRAISTYKVMHSSKNKNNSAEMKQASCRTGEVDSKHDFENLEAIRVADEKSSIPAIAPDSGETSNTPDLVESNHTDSQAAETHLDASGGQDIRHSLEAQNNYQHTQGVDEYNRLVGQYYEVEEQRQKILEQLNQYGGWNYQYMAEASSSGVQYPNPQNYSTSTCHVSAPNVPCSCSSSCCQCLLPLCTSVPSCTLGGTCVGKHCNDHSVARYPETSFPCEGDNILKTAIGVAERAMSTIKTTISGDSDKKEEKERNHSELDQSNGSEPDLTVVLNAWYSAGFYTGKYLAENSIADRKQG